MPKKLSGNITPHSYHTIEPPLRIARIKRPGQDYRTHILPTRTMSMLQAPQQCSPGSTPRTKAIGSKTDAASVEGDFDRARPDFDQAIALDPKYKDAIYRKAISEVAVNDTDQAIELLDQVIASDDKYIVLH